MSTSINNMCFYLHANKTNSTKITVKQALKLGDTCALYIYTGMMSIDELIYTLYINIFID